MFKKWETVFFSTNADDYYCIKGKLINAGIKHKSKVENSSQNSMSCSQSINYEISVMGKDLDKANSIINCR